MWIMVPRLISHKLQLSMQYGDLTIEVGETNYYDSHVSQQPSFESFFVFSLVLMGMQDLILLFPSRSQTQFLQLCQF